MPTKSRAEIMDFYAKRAKEIRKSGREPSLTDADPRDLLRMVELDRSPHLENDEEKTASEATMDPFWTAFEKAAAARVSMKQVRRAASSAAGRLKKLRPTVRDAAVAAAGGAAGAVPAYMSGHRSGKEKGQKAGRRSAYRDISRTVAPTED